MLIICLQNYTFFKTIHSLNAIITDFLHSLSANLPLLSTVSDDSVADKKQCGSLSFLSLTRYIARCYLCIGWIGIDFNVSLTIPPHLFFRYAMVWTYQYQSLKEMQPGRSKLLFVILKGFEWWRLRVFL